MPRAVSPAVGVVLLAAVTVVSAGVVGVLAADLGQLSASPAPLVLSGGADVATGRIELRHDGGPAIDVRELRVRISIDGTDLRRQPPVPFAGARGFRGAPSGPFNAAADPRWEPGERAALRLAGTNHPALGTDALVVVEVYRNDLALARVELTAR